MDLALHLLNNGFNLSISEKTGKHLHVHISTYRLSSVLPARGAPTFLCVASVWVTFEALFLHWICTWYLRICKEHKEIKQTCLEKKCGPCAISCCLRASPRAENRSSLMRVSALRLYSRCWAFSCMADRVDSSMSVSCSTQRYFPKAWVQKHNKTENNPTASLLNNIKTTFIPDAVTHTCALVS